MANPSTQTPPAGWYPNNGRMQWWDGVEWTARYGQEVTDTSPPRWAAPPAPSRIERVKRLLRLN